MTDLTTTTADHAVGTTVTVLQNMDSQAIGLTIESNSGDEDLECFEVTLGDPGTTTGVLDAYQTTTTICIKDNEITSE